MKSADLSQQEAPIALGVVVKALDRWGKCNVKIIRNGEQEEWLIEGIAGMFTKINDKFVVESEFWKSVLEGCIKLVEISR